MSGQTMDAENHRLLLTSSPAYNSFLKTTENDTLQIQPKYQVLFVITSPSPRASARPRVPRLRVPLLRVPRLRVPSLRVPSPRVSSPESYVPRPRVPRPTSPSSTSQSPSPRPTLSHSRVTVRQSTFHAN